MSLTKVTNSMILGAPVNTLDFPTISDAVDASGTNGIVQVPGSPTYTATTNWKGRQHQTYEAPFNLNNITWAGANLNARMCVANNILYCCEYSNDKVAMFALTDPRNPTYLGSFATASQPRHVDVIGRYAFVCCHGAASIQVYDVTQPGSAGLVGTITTNSQPKMFQILGNEIYVANFSGTVQKFTYTLPAVGSVGFEYNLEATATAAIGPLCLSVNGEGLLVVCGLNSANVILMGSSTLNVLTSVAVGGGQHGTISFVGSQQFLVTDSAQDRIYSANVDGFSITVTGFAATSPNPEQIEIVGNRCYVPSLTNAGAPAFLDCYDITNAATPVLFKSVPLTVTGAGFTAYTTDGQTGYVYVNGHTAPYNIDVIEVSEGPSGRLPLNASEYLQSRNAGFSSAQVGQLRFRYRSVISATVSSTTSDGVIRLGSGGSVNLHNPLLNPGQVLVIENVTTDQVRTITNVHVGGFVTTKLFPGESFVLCAEDFGGSFQWDVVASDRSRTFANYTTVVSNYTPLNTDDYIRVGVAATIALPDPAVMLNKQLIIKNVSTTLSSNVTNAYAGYSGTLAIGEAVTIIATTFSGLAQWDAVAKF